MGKYIGKKRVVTKKGTHKKSRIIFGIIILALAIGLPFIIDGYVIAQVEDRLVSEEEAKDLGADCILVLGAGLRPDGTPNLMLRDRLDTGIALYKDGAAPKLLLTGDNGQKEYDEVNAMKRYVLDAGIPAEDIFLDHAGFSTYESIYRGKAIFEVKKALIVTQRYHQYRALYAADKLELEAYGVVSDAMGAIYSGQEGRDLREFLARNKDFFKLLIKPEPTYLGEVIPISGSGLASHD